MDLCIGVSEVLNSFNQVSLENWILEMLENFLVLTIALPSWRKKNLRREVEKVTYQL